MDRSGNWKSLGVSFQWFLKCFHVFSLGCAGKGSADTSAPEISVQWPDVEDHAVKLLKCSPKNTAVVLQELQDSRNIWTNLDWFTGTGWGNFVIAKFGEFSGFAGRLGQHGQPNWGWGKAREDYGNMSFLNAVTLSISFCFATDLK